MATLVLSAAGAAVGGAVGGPLGAMAGRALGAVGGGLIDQQVFGRGSQTVETGRVEAFRVQGGAEGAAVHRLFGRMRVAGQMIWSTDFLEHVDVSRQGGKGGGGVQTREYRYSVSFAVALCEGPITRIGRVWADGNEISLADHTYRLHKGDENQAPDPLIDAVEGGAPAFRGVAYLVFEDLQLGPFGNRIPQLNVEVHREPPAANDYISTAEMSAPLSELVKGVALSPGAGEFVLDTVPVARNEGRGRTAYENVNTLADRADLLPALDQLGEEAPNCGSVSLVVSWFGDDLRCGACSLRPGVEIAEKQTAPYSWQVNGVSRGGAHLVSQNGDGRPSFGGTPSDLSVIRAIQEMNGRGLSVMFYPFLLMDIPSGNALPDPYGGPGGQPAFPWRGRITLDAAPGQVGSTDKTAAAAAEVASFFGAAAPTDFSQSGTGVNYSGPAEWSYRRFILHYAHLCAAAGGVEGFCIGSEMRALTQVRDGAASYPAVRELISLTEDVRAILGPDVKIGYAADWSEYFGHQPGDGSGDVFYHLDPLWAHGDIDFVGIDNYLPLSDWRYRQGHLDEGGKSIYALSYLKGNVEGGEGYDWYYASDADRDAQIRTPIADTAHGEDWVFRPKDIQNWWRSAHHDRPAGVKAATPTAWVPESKPIRFTELGCPAVDLGANRPNVFIDAKSSESALPYYSRGARDDYMQQRYLQATFGYWAEQNPTSSVYGGGMIDLDKCYVWTWDARPFPDFPSRRSVWADGGNHRRGHWISGRLGAASLAAVVADICIGSELTAFDVSELHGVVDGYIAPGGDTARRALQPLMLAYGFDAVESGGVLKFRHRGGPVAASLAGDTAVLAADNGKEWELTRQAEGEAPRSVRLSFVDSERGYETGATEAAGGDALSNRVERADLRLALEPGQARLIAERWLEEARSGREGANVAMGRSTMALEPGDIVELEGAPGAALYRIERAEELGRRDLTLTKVESLAHVAAPSTESPSEPKAAQVAAPVEAVFLDVPLLSETETVAPRIAAFADPWTSGAALYLSRSSEDFELVGSVPRPAVVGETLSELPAMSPGLWARGEGVDVKIFGGGLSAKSELAVLNGDNLAALRAPGGDWEIVQFRSAALVGEGVYRLSHLLRGQRGTDAVMPAVTPAGAEFVLLNGDVQPFGLDGQLRGVTLDYRIGPSHKSVSHDSFSDFSATFAGVGYRPYRPAHLRAAISGGDLAVSWVRRSRLDGDAWGGGEAPLGEMAELYRVRISSDGVTLREAEVSTPRHVYTAAEIAADGAAGAVTVSVAQFSDRFGYGPEAEVIVNV